MDPPAQPTEFKRDVSFIYTSTDFARLENWYDKIKDFTFGTKWVPLPAHYAKALCQYKEYLNFYFNAKVLEVTSSDDPAEQEKAMMLCYTPTMFAEIQQQLLSVLTPEELLPIEELTILLEELINSVSEPGRGAFVRLSSRSPKDTALVSELTFKYLQEMIANSTVDPDSEEALIENMSFYTRATWRALKVDSGKDAINLLLKSNRTHVDLALANLKQDEFQMDLIVREWVEINPEWEFRVFVNHKKLTACTQYYPWIYNPEFNSRLDEITATLENFWEKIKDLLPDEFFTIDVVLNPQQLDHVRVVEVNPPPPAAGGGLFDWDKPEDVNAALNGPFEVRVCKSFPHHEWKKLHPPIRNWIKSCRKAQRELNSKWYCTIC